MLLSVRPFKTEAVAKPSNLEGFVFPESILDGAPIDLEIGCGVGWHPIRYAKENPTRRLIAIEHTRQKFQSFTGRLVHHQSLTNILPIHADAIRWITHAVHENTFERIFLLYPNPEPKAPNKRWFRAPFFSKLLETLKPGGEIHLATNVESYADEARTFGQAVWQLELKSDRVIKAPDRHEPRTHFEKKYLERGETCFDLVFAKPHARPM